MAVTDFSNGLSVGKGFIVSQKNTPTRVGDRIATISEMSEIPSPWVGQLVYVEDEKLYYIITSLKAKKVGPISIADAVVDTYEKFDQGSSEGSGPKWIDVL